MSNAWAPAMQASWDWRAAGNFIGGGAGSGLIVLAACSGAQGVLLAVALAAGLALIGVGLLCVWFEIGRPLRALHVFFNPRTSWMSREAFTATLLFPVTAVAAAGITALVWPAVALALVFVYCQSRMLRAARGIPAWREPLISPLIVVSGLVEGGGAFLLLAAASGHVPPALLVAHGVLVVVRAQLWRAYRRRVQATAPAKALTALDAAGRVLLYGGTLVPLALLAVTAVLDAGSAVRGAVIGLAAVLAWGAGAWLKYVLVTRAGYNQGFRLVHLPVRGQRA